MPVSRPGSTAAAALSPAPAQTTTDSGNPKVLAISGSNVPTGSQAILWNDGRTAKEGDYLNETVGQDNLSQYTANIAFAGFTAPKLLWMRDNEPELFATIEKIMLPKDYLVY